MMFTLFQFQNFYYRWINISNHWSAQTQRSSICRALEHVDLVSNVAYADKNLRANFTHNYRYLHLNSVFL
jgi:hypothetical protein